MSGKEQAQILAAADRVRAIVEGYSAAASAPGAGLVEQLRARRARELLAQAESVDRRCADPALLAASQRKLEADLDRVVSTATDNVVVHPIDPASGALSEAERRAIVIREWCSGVVATVALERRAKCWLEVARLLEDIGRARHWWQLVVAGVEVH